MTATWRWSRPGSSGSRSTTCWRAASAAAGQRPHIKAVPGRKTDVKDAEWIAELLRHGLLRGSFVPTGAQRELRDLTRTRTTLVDERTAVVNRLQKVLEDANIKLAGVATDSMGASGRAMLRALIAGEEDDPSAGGAGEGRLRRKCRQLRAGAGRPGDRASSVPAARAPGRSRPGVEQMTSGAQEIAQRLRRGRDAALCVSTASRASGGGRREIMGPRSAPDLGRLPSSRHLASWAGCAPATSKARGRRLSGKTRKGERLFAAPSLSGRMGNRPRREE